MFLARLFRSWCLSPPWSGVQLDSGELLGQCDKLTRGGGGGGGGGCMMDQHLIQGGEAVAIHFVIGSSGVCHLGWHI